MSNFEGVLEFGAIRTVSPAILGSRQLHCLEDSGNHFLEGPRSTGSSYADWSHSNYPCRNPLEAFSGVGIASYNSTVGQLAVPNKPITWRALRTETTSSDRARADLKRVEGSYIVTIGKEQIVSIFNAKRGLPGLLLEAIKPLRDSFGQRLLQLKANSDGDDISLTAVVLWPDEAESARVALEQFDKQWWIDNCNRSHGRLVFDYELADGF